MPRITRAARRRFLTTLGETGDTRSAARSSGVEREAWYDLREADPGFAAEWRRAEARAIDALEGEAMRRALKGVAEPTFYQGKRVGRSHKRSEALLTLLLKTRLPERYGERAREGGSGEDDALRALLAAIDGETRTIGGGGDDD